MRVKRLARLFHRVHVAILIRRFASACTRRNRALDECAALLLKGAPDAQLTPVCRRIQRYTRRAQKTRDAYFVLEHREAQ